MASSPLTFGRRKSVTPRDGERGPGHGLSTAGFITASVLAHGVAWAVLVALPATGVALTAVDTTFEFEVEPLPPEAPEPELALPPEPEPETPPRVREPDPSPPPLAEAPPPVVVPEDVGVHSVDDGLAVDAVAATGDGGGVLAARAPAEGSPDGVVGGTGTGEIDAPTQHPEVDHRRLAREWMLEVNRAVMRRAIRDYPRAARRSQLEGTVIVSITVDDEGRIVEVEIARGAGHETLDRAAIAAVQAVGTLPEPPEIFNRRGRPLTMPIAYRLQ